MSHPNEILTYVIEHLGVPLMSSLPGASADLQAPNQEAEIMARLLTSSVELGMAISSKMNVPSDVAKAEALRFRLTSLAAHALADRIKLKDKELSEADIDSLKAAVDSLFVFSENFSFDDQGMAYLEKLGLKSVDAGVLSPLSVVQALLPVLSCMDHKDRGLFPNIADRLVKEASDLSIEYVGKSPAASGADPIVKLKMLELLAQVFAGIYPAVMAASKPLGDVWQEFDRKKSLLLLLIDYLLVGQVDVGGVDDEDFVKPEVQSPKQEREDVSMPVEKAESAPVTTEAVVPSIFAPKVVEAPAASVTDRPDSPIEAPVKPLAGNPLASFAKKDPAVSPVADSVTSVQPDVEVPPVMPKEQKAGMDDLAALGALPGEAEDGGWSGVPHDPLAGAVLEEEIEVSSVEDKKPEANPLSFFKKAETDS